MYSVLLTVPALYVLFCKFWQSFIHTVPAQPSHPAHTSLLKHHSLLCPGSFNDIPFLCVSSLLILTACCVMSSQCWGVLGEEWNLWAQSKLSLNSFKWHFHKETSLILLSLETESSTDDTESTNNLMKGSLLHLVPISFTDIGSSSTWDKHFLYVNSMAETCVGAQKNDQSSAESINFLERIQSDKCHSIEHLC